jgi:hypothetical protein
MLRYPSVGAGKVTDDKRYSNRVAKICNEVGKCRGERRVLPDQTPVDRSLKVSRKQHFYLQTTRRARGPNVTSNGLIDIPDFIYTH